MRVPTSGRAAAVLLTVLVAVGGTAGCGRVADRQATGQSIPAQATPPAPATAPAGGTVDPSSADPSAADPSAVDPGTVAQVERQVDAAQQFLDGAEAQLGQDGR